MIDRQIEERHTNIDCHTRHYKIVLIGAPCFSTTHGTQKITTACPSWGILDKVQAPTKAESE